MLETLTALLKCLWDWIHPLRRGKLPPSGLPSACAGGYNAGHDSLSGDYRGSLIPRITAGKGHG